MSTCIQYAYKFSDEFTIDSYQKAIKSFGNVHALLKHGNPIFNKKWIAYF